jgi:hypothetical protein
MDTSVQDEETWLVYGRMHLYYKYGLRRDTELQRTRCGMRCCCRFSKRAALGSMGGSTSG